MKPLIFLPLIFVLSYVVQLFLPWWSMALVCYGVCFALKVNKWYAFSGSLLAVFFLWVLKAYFADQNFDVPMSSLLGGLFGNVSTSAVFFLTGLIGGMVAGFSGLLGSWTGTLFQQK
jgi:DNA-binding transcriptional regulator of glucitol operon